MLNNNTGRPFHYPFRIANQPHSLGKKRSEDCLLSTPTEAFLTMGLCHPGPGEGSGFPVFMAVEAGLQLLHSRPFTCFFLKQNQYFSPSSKGDL